MIIETIGENFLQISRYRAGDKTFDLQMVGDDTLIIKVPVDLTIEITHNIDNRVELLYKKKK